VTKIPAQRLSPLPSSQHTRKEARGRLDVSPDGPEHQPTPPDPPRWWLRAGAAGLAGISAVGAIAYVNNAPALEQMGEIELYPQSLPETADAPQAATRPRAASSSGRGDARVHIPGSQARNFLEQLRQQPRVARQLDGQLRQAQQTLQQQLSQVNLGAGEVLLDVRAPLPTSQRSFLHVGEVDLPSLGYRALSSEALPARVAYQMQPLETGLRVQIRPLTQVEAPAGPAQGVLLGAVRVEVSASQTQLDLRGQAQLSLDLDGQGSARQLQRLQGRPGQEPLRQQLQQRQQTGQRLQASLEQQGLLSQVEQAAQQEIQVEAQLQLPSRLASSTLYLWAVPDQSGDGKADLQLTRSDDWQGLQQLQLRLNQAELNSGKQTSYLQRQVQSRIESQLSDQLGQLQTRLPQLIESEVQAAAREGLAQAQREANRQLSRLYQQQIAVGSIPLTLGQIAVRGDALEVDLATRNSGALSASTSPSGEHLRISLELSASNRHLRHSVDWPNQLEAIRKQADLRDLRFAQGQEPQLSFRQGRLHLTTEVIAKTKTGLGSIIDGFFGSTVHTRLSVPLEVKVQDGRLVVAADRNAVEFQQAQEKLPFNLLDLMPTRIVTNLLSQLALGTGLVRPGEMNTQLDLSQPFGVRFTRAQLDKKGNLIVDFQLDAQAARWAAQKATGR
jgi:hypothetical protein